MSEETDPKNDKIEETSLSPDPEENTSAQRDLSQRFMVQATFPSLGREARWESINSYPGLIDAVRASSECLQAVQIIFGQTPELTGSINDVRIRIFDKEKDAVVVYEDEDGSLHCEDDSLLAD